MPSPPRPEQVLYQCTTEVHGTQQLLLSGLVCRVQLVQLSAAAQMSARVSVHSPATGSMILHCYGAAAWEAALRWDSVGGRVAWDSGKGWLLLFDQPQQAATFYGERVQCCSALRPLLLQA